MKQKNRKLWELVRAVTPEFGAVYAEALDAPFGWRSPCLATVSDLFHPCVPTRLVDRAFAVMGNLPQHIFLVTTEHPDTMRRYMSDDAVAGRIARAGKAGGNILQREERGEYFAACKAWPLPNVVLGVPVVDQPTADARIPQLLETPAALRLAQMEPLSGPVDLLRMPCVGQHWDWLTGERMTAMEKKTTGRIDWVVCGGGPEPVHPDWVRKLRDRCRTAGVPFMFTGWGDWVPEDQPREFGGKVLLLQGEGPIHDLHSPGGISVSMRRVGAKKSGRMLDSEHHDASPNWPGTS